MTEGEDMDREQLIYAAISGVESKFRCCITLLDTNRILLARLPKLRSAHFAPACNMVKKDMTNDLRCMQTDIQQMVVHILCIQKATLGQKVRTILYRDFLLEQMIVPHLQL